MKTMNKTAALAAMAVLSLGAASVLYFRSPAGSAVAPKSAVTDSDARAATAASAPLGNLLPRSTREAAWQVGTERIYAVDFGSTLSSDENSEQGWFSIVGSAQLTLAVAAADAQHIELIGALAQPTVTLGNDALANPALRTSIVDALRQRFVIQLQPNGRIVSLSAARQTDGIAHGLLRNIVAALQFVEPPPGASRTEWLTEETDHNGTYKARYRQVEPGVFDKVKLSYSFLQMVKVMQVGKSAPAPKIEATTTITCNEDGVIRKIDAREKVEVTWGKKPLLVASNATLALTGVQKRTLDSPDVSQMVTMQLFQVRPATGLLAEQKLQRKRELVAGASFQTLSGDLAKLPATLENRDARLDVMSRMSALFELDPSSVDSARKTIRQASPDDARTLLGALSGAHGPDAQRVLAELARDPSIDPGLRNNATIELGTVEEPTAETLRELRAASNDQDPNVHAQATLALGGAVRRSDASSGPTDTTHDAVDDMNRGYQSAKTPDDRRLYVNALGNAGSANGLPSLKNAVNDPDPSVRSAAVGALRYIHGDEVDALLVTAMLRDPEAEVRAAAIEAVQYRPLSPALLEAGQSVLQNEKEPQLRSAVVSWFAPNLFKVPALVAVLRAVAASDPDENVKRAAESALSTVPAG
jgi:HEAT repeat protein